MPLNKEVLGAALYNYRESFNHRTIEQLTVQYGTLECAQREMALGEAEIIIYHFAQPGNVTVNVTTAGTATAQAGTGIGQLNKV